MVEWRETTWGAEVSLEYGKGIRGYADAVGPYRVFGSNGPVGWTNEPLAPGPGVILGRKGAYRGVQFSKEPFFVIDTAYYVVPKSELDMRWLYYAIIHHKLGEIDDGSPIPSTTRAAVYVRDLSVPELAEQEAIASVLGALDDKIELNRQMNETLEGMARAIFRDWFVDFGPTRAKTEGRAPYLASDLCSLFPDRLDAEGKPEGWELRPVRDFAELRGGRQLEKERIARIGTIPVFGGAGVMGFTDEHNADGFVISVGRVGAYCGQFFSHRGKAWINNNASLVRHFKGISGEWLFQSLRHADIEVIKKGAAQPFVSNTDVGNMPIIWPGESVVGQFADAVVPLMLRIEHNDAESRTLAAMRDLLLPKLMSGEIRVQDAEKHVEKAT